MKIEGIKINFLGDSITEGHGVSDIQSYRYDNVLSLKYGVIANNYGIGGSRLAHQRTASECPRADLCFCGRAYDMDSSADVIVVYGGVNDYLHGDAPIGNDGDKTPATFKGGVRFLMSTLPELYPHAKIVFMTPARCVGCLAPSSAPIKQSDAMPLKAYVDIIKNTAKECGIPVLDLYDGLGIDPNLPEDLEKYAPDGLHFNDVGHAVLAQKLAEFLMEL